MITFILSFLLGDLFLQSFRHLPPAMLVYSTCIITMIVWMIVKKRLHFFYMLPAFMLGLAWTYYIAHSTLAWQLPNEVEGRNMLVTGYVKSLPVTDEWQTNFLFAIEKSALVKLSWRDASQTVKVGDKWQFVVRLKRIHGTQNPGAFDYEAWALQKGLRATGYVVASQDNKILSHSRFRSFVDQWREHLQSRLQAYLPTTKTSPWLMALLLGERTGITHDDWQVLRNTGTNHLMAIAGLHIGIIAGIAHMLTSWLWRRSARLVFLLPAQLAGACAALMMAILYSMLAGFSIPTQRACIMLTIFIFALLLRRKINPWHAWSLALLIVLLMNPLSVLTESFWLSFGTIALIIYGMSGRLSSSGWWWKWGRVQWVIGLGLIPLTLFFFQECSLISFAANSIAIPWLAFFILPFCFLSVIFLFIYPPATSIFLMLADKSLAGLWLVLTWFSQLHFSIWQQFIPSYFHLTLAILASIFLLSPAGFPGRWIGILWFLPLIFYTPNKPAHGEFWLTLLDVGQGLSVIVQTQNHTLVYDAGPKFLPNFDMGESVVIPYLHTIGTKKIDMLVVSHGDNDHIGGTQILQKTLPISSIKTSVPEKIPSTTTDYCLAGYAWEWDNVTFSFIYPSQQQLHLGNDSSCVLLIDNGQQRALLPGDIEKFAENELLRQSPQQLQASVFIAAHHGSKTSGLKNFISAIHPQYVLYATGYRNRYHFPHPSVMATYDAMHVKQLNTAETGAIQFKFGQEKNILPPILYRQISKRYWYQ